MTAEQMLARWRELLAAGCTVEWPADTEQQTCWIRVRRRIFSGSDPDPLCAFAAACRAWEEAQSK